MTAVKTESGPDFLVMVRELTEPYVARIVLDSGSIHSVKVPSLLVQLHSLEPSNGGGRRGFASRPVACLEALDLLADIDREVARWIRNLGYDDAATTEACVRQLHSLTPQLDTDTKSLISDDLYRWYCSARILSGWDTAPFKPHNTCPHCERLDAIRIRFEEKIGHCVNCRATWNPATIGLLAEWIRHENGELEDESA